MPNDMELGVIVNDIPTQTTEEQKLEADIQMLELSRINLRVTPVLFDRLNRQAEYHGLTIEEHCANVLRDHMEQRIGVAHIDGPSIVSGTSVAKKVTGPSNKSIRGH